MAEIIGRRISVGGGRPTRQLGVLHISDAGHKLGSSG